MKIILSRKGMDASAGGMASPIIDNQLVMLPIPTDGQGAKYDEIHACDTDLETILDNLSRGKFGKGCRAHFDPDLVSASMDSKREKAWRPVFGQHSGALTHLESQGVGVGDLFLFYGWYRFAERVKGVFKYVGDKHGFHAIFGWLQVGQILDCTMPLPADLNWARYHPHFDGEGYGKVYVAADALTLAGNDPRFPGAGVLKWKPHLRLSAPDQNKRSVWKMPSWFTWRDRKPPMSWNSDPAKYMRHPDGVQVKTASPGQEFVIDCKQYPEAVGWAQKLVEAGGP